MSATRSDTGGGSGRGKEFLADLAAWNRANGEDNSEQLQRLRRNLRRARRAELTPRQAEMLHLYYDLGLTMTQVAQELGSTSPPYPGPLPGGGNGSGGACNTAFNLLHSSRWGNSPR